MNMSWIKSPWVQARAHAALLFQGGDPGGVPVLKMEGPFRFFDSKRMESRSVFDAPGAFVGEALPPARGTLRDATQTRQEGHVRVDLEEPGVLLYKVTYHPGWQAFLYGKRVPTMQLTPGLVGVRVPAGEHELRIRYSAGARKLILLVAGLLAAAGLEFVRWPGVPAAAPVRRSHGT